MRENRTHGSMRRREATPDQSATAARSPDASRRPYITRTSPAIALLGGAALQPTSASAAKHNCVATQR